jgi:5-methylcytosine-specific restriction endonuclease McrA
MMNTKICNKCERELPATDVYFQKRKNRKFGVVSTCKECFSEYQRQYRQKNKEKIAKTKKVHYQKNKEQVLEHQKEYQQRNKEKISERRKRYYQKNKCRIAEYQKNNKEKIAEYRKDYVKENKEKFVLYRRKRDSLKKELQHTLTASQWSKIKTDFDNCCAYCGKKKKLEQEHFIPLTKGGEYTHNNIIPACKSCNSSKYNRDFFEWFKSYEYYSEEREKKILKYLDYDKTHTQQLSIL